MFPEVTDEDGLRRIAASESGDIDPFYQSVVSFVSGGFDFRWLDFNF
jgi:hypothetical protein